MPDRDLQRDAETGSTDEQGSTEKDGAKTMHGRAQNLANFACAFAAQVSEDRRIWTRTLLHAQHVEAHGCSVSSDRAAKGALFDSGRHSPTVTRSPTSTRKLRGLEEREAGHAYAGEQCTDSVL